MQKIENFINGELLPPKLANYLDNFEPATGKVYSQIPDSDATDVENAVKAAEKAFHSWANTPAKKRSDIILKLSNLIL